MASVLINGYGITLADMKPPKVKQIPTPWKQTMQNFATIWHGWLVGLAVSLGALMLSNVLYAYLFSVSTAGSYTNNVFLTTKLM
jgi:hypothetical protein